MQTPRNNDDFLESNETIQPKYKLSCPHKEYISEFFGTYLFLLLSLGNIAELLLTNSSMGWTGVALSWSFNLMFGLYIASFNSKAHLNPCVSLCMYIDNSNTFNLIQLIMYTLMQLLGAFLAAGTVYGIYYDHINLIGKNAFTAGIFSPYPDTTLTRSNAFANECLGTAILIFGIFSIIQHPVMNKNVPIFIGLLLGAIALSFSSTGFPLNPARYLGPMIFTSMVGFDSFSYFNFYFWIPLVAEYIGAILGYFLFYIFVKSQS
jgi:MIP family channel proteins